KKYTAPSMADALAAIRSELGPHAIIVHSTTTRRGPLGLLQRPVVEVVAAIDEGARPKTKPVVQAQRRPPPRPMPAPKPTDVVRAIAEGQQPVAPAALREMQQHVKELRGAI